VSKSGKTMEACLSLLLNEIQQAVVWSRPSILLAVHRSKNDQPPAIAAMEHKLENITAKVKHIIPESGSMDILHGIIREFDLHDSIIFVQDLGSQPEAYAGLNIYRELIVERRLKIIFWLTQEEMVLLAQQAPDFWAFRHRVIEFPTGRSAQKNNLPSGALLWYFDNSNQNLEMIRRNIAFEESLLQNIPLHDEATAAHAQITGNLAYYYWLLGENQKAADLLQPEIRQIGLLDLKDEHSMLLNMQAINCFDQNDNQGALRSIEQALELKPEKSLLWSNHGVICRSAMQSRKSLSSLRRALKLDPVSFEGWGILGYVYISMGKYASALPCFEKAHVLNSESVQLYPAIAICHLRTGNYDRFDETVKQMSNDISFNDYFSICREGLLGNRPAALSRLRELVQGEKLSSISVRRDPNLHFIFGVAALQEIL